MNLNVEKSAEVLIFLHFTVCNFYDIIRELDELMPALRRVNPKLPEPALTETVYKKSQGHITDYIKGEEFSIFNESTRKAFTVCDELRNDRDLERYNNGITIVVI